MKSILVTGCNRGVGLGLIRHLVKAENPPKNVIATCRSIEKATDLRQLAEQNKNVKLLEFEIANFDGYKELASKVESIVKDDGLNVLFNNAGVSPKFTRIQFVKPEQMLETFKVNTMGPVLLTKALLPLLQNASKNNPNASFGAGKALVVNTSSILGSIASNADGGLYPYKCSKAALNMATKSLSIDLYKDGIMVTSIHPGWVKTEMGGVKAPMEIDASAESILKLIGTFNESHNGGFYQWDGKQLLW